MTSRTKPARPRKMSFDQFLTHLRKLKGLFTASDSGVLRAGWNVCPVSAVCNHLKGTAYSCQVVGPAHDMNMSRKLAWLIADAADLPARGLSPLARNYRNRMLRALKLRERV